MSSKPEVSSQENHTILKSDLPSSVQTMEEVYETGLSRKHRLGSFWETLGFRGKHPSFLRANNFLSGPLYKENTKVKFSLLGRKVCFTQPVSQAPGFGQT